MEMVRRFLSLLLAIALFGAVGQSAAVAAGAASPAMPSKHMTMSMADCMKMMQASGPEKTAPGPHKGCVPGDCPNVMMTCSSLTAVPAADVTTVVPTDQQGALLVGSSAPTLTGQSVAPDIRPPIA